MASSIRRILLSLKEGYAISGFVLKKDNEILNYHTDFEEIRSNLKKVRLKLLDQEEKINYQIISISISNQNYFFARDIERFTNIFKVINPDLRICELGSEKKMEIDLFINN